MTHCHHNKNFGEEYVMSPVMETYVNSTNDGKGLLQGCPVFNGVTLFGTKFASMLDNWYENCMNNISYSPNSMSKYGSSDTMTTDEYNYIMRTLRPFIDEYFRDNNYEPYYFHRLKLVGQFCVHYSQSTDKKLDIHTDDSDITINICLKNTFAPNTSTINFTTTNDALFSTKKNNLTSISLEKGDILIHKGSHEHYVTNINNQQGERCNLILWLKFEKEH